MLEKFDIISSFVLSLFGREILTFLAAFEFFVLPVQNFVNQEFKFHRVQQLQTNK